MENNSGSAIIDEQESIQSSMKYNTGLVLSGGAARGFAHLGVFKALREKGITAGIVSGVSAGAIAGAFYCDGFEPEEVLELFNNTKIFRFVKLEFNKQGLMNISGLTRVLKNNLRTKSIEDLRKPLVITITNLMEGTTRYITQGDLVNAVVASSSIPVIFKPVIIDGDAYIDGGIKNNLPIEPIQGLCRNLIGVHVNPVGMYNPEKGLIHLALRSFHLSVASGIPGKVKQLTCFIEPSGLAKYSYYDIEGRYKMFDLGYEEAMKVLAKTGFRSPAEKIQLT
ncbi:MAG: patatin [Bacteroidia bacterium]|nr:MAG: patatin [Bacteroidia bacterium]